MPEIPFLSAAREEFLAAAAYYEAASPVGAEFIDDVESAVNRLATFPDHGNLCVAGTRRLVLRRFPFDVVHLNSQNQVVIVTIAHQRRSPYHWRDRI